jgi:hypothetical protein
VRFLRMRPTRARAGRGCRALDALLQGAHHGGGEGRGGDLGGWDVLVPIVIEGAHERVDHADRTQFGTQALREREAGGVGRRAGAEGGAGGQRVGRQDVDPGAGAERAVRGARAQSGAERLGEAHRAEEACLHFGVGSDEVGPADDAPWANMQGGVDENVDAAAERACQLAHAGGVGDVERDKLAGQIGLAWEGPPRVGDADEDL